MIGDYAQPLLDVFAIGYAAGVVLGLIAALSGRGR